MMIWGIMVIADSPQYSALVAQTAPAENRGTALTFVTCLGFAITIVSIQCLDYFFGMMKENTAAITILAIGPIAGLFALWRLLPYQKNSKGQIPV